jgi:hypothetical protein
VHLYSPHTEELIMSLLIWVEVQRREGGEGSAEKGEERQLEIEERSGERRGKDEWEGDRRGREREMRKEIYKIRMGGRGRERAGREGGREREERDKGR